jgi:hypothetical protein
MYALPHISLAYRLMVSGTRNISFSFDITGKKKNDSMGKLFLSKIETPPKNL